MPHMPKPMLCGNSAELFNSNWVYPFHIVKKKQYVPKNLYNRKMVVNVPIEYTVIIIIYFSLGSYDNK